MFCLSLCCGGMNSSPERMSVARDGSVPAGSSTGYGTVSNSSNVGSPALQFDTVSRASGSELSLSLGAGDNEVTPEKFAKLASEYSKFRSQFSVLRKAFVEEKSKSQKLEEQLKQREQDIRKLEQETESLNFRNTQLSKRVGVLQNDLESESAPKSRGFFNFAADSSSSSAADRSSRHRAQSNASSNSGPASAGVAHENDLFEELNQELKNKMIENELLKTNIASLESKLSEEEAICARKIKESQSGVEESIEELNNQIKKLNISLTKAKQDKADADSALKNLKMKFENSENVSRKQIQELGEQLRKKVNESLSPANSSHSVYEQGFARSGSFSGDVRNRLMPGLPPRSGSLSIHKRSTLGGRQSMKEKMLAMSTVCMPSHSSGDYHDEELRNQVIDQFSAKICELICALSNVHSQFAKKVSILFAMFNNGEYNFYFDSKNSANSLQNQNFLRQLSQTLQSGYDTHLIHLEESTKEFMEEWKKSFEVIDQSEEMENASELKRHTTEIVQKFGDYIDYLKKAEPMAISCVSSWSKTLKSFNSTSNEDDIPQEVYDKLCSNEKRFDLIQKHESVSLNIQEFVRILCNIFGSIKLLLTRSMGSDRCLTAFNQCMQRVSSLERCQEELKKNLATKYALEHELNITCRSDMLETDDCLLSALVFLKTTISDIRVLMEVHYFFFVCPVTTGKQQNAPGMNRLAAQPSPMQNRFIAEEEEGEGDEEDSIQLATQKEIESLKQEKETFILELEHKALLLERESKRIAELELKVQDLLIQLNDRPDNNNDKPKLNDQLSITSSASITASPMTDCFGVPYPINKLVPEESNGTDLETVLKEIAPSEEPKKEEYCKEQLTKIWENSEGSSTKLMSSQLECTNLRQLYTQLESAKVTLEEMLSKNWDELSTTQEEFRTSVENYQAQLQALTEHLALQNDTIAAQREQIDTLMNGDGNSGPKDGASSTKSTSTASSFVSKAFAGFKKS